MFSRRRKADSRCTSAGRVTAKLLLSFLALSASPVASAGSLRQDAQLAIPIEAAPMPPLILEPPKPTEQTFTLRHIYHHGTNRHPGLHRKKDVIKADAGVWLAAEDGYKEERLLPLKARSSPVRIQRLVDRRPSVVDPIVAMGRERGFVSVLSPEAWTLDDVWGPDITDKGTVLSLALMASNAYVQTPDQADWEEVGRPFNRSMDFGWEGDGLRGHIWADEYNSTIVIGLKGTSPAVFDGDGTTTNDKVNDNLFFSCCCAQQGPWTWHQVCDCATSTYSCNNTCVVQALREENRYYQAARELYANVTELYPNSNIWLSGHSLGGAVSSMLGLTYGVPVVTFQAVPEALPASRLGLPVPHGSDPSAPQTREYTGAFHFGHTADPIYIGTCNGATASCSFGGYALESACHTGRECVYDTVGDKGWRVGIGTHKIRSVIHDVIMKYDTVPECKFTPECRDCGSWKMYESNGTEPISSTTSTATSTKSRTRTETCKTPGWWGCLDETTSTGGTRTSTEVTTTTITTCLTPGWFGCKDKVTATTTTSVQPTQTTTTSTSLSTTSTTCLTPGRFWGCSDATSTMISDTTTSQSSTITEPPTLPPTEALPTTTPTETPPTSKARCLRRSWYGMCEEWDEGEQAEAKEDM
ncbi:autophagy protein atg15 [Podospora aff. communis PSN243]|uniref:triacylglycerol lipase n=1 Tax=Podospora aff. communis PSN243 TaxID=3040156 RepID=A0AAV9H5B9_9PEZI|nr:autophagy protein atg15 [Podospora aff. communis PSN243]